jgi:hypothetical protein
MAGSDECIGCGDSVLTGGTAIGGRLPGWVTTAFGVAERGGIETGTGCAGKGVVI